MTIKRITRDRRLTPEEKAKYDTVRQQVAEELPALATRHHQRMAGVPRLEELLKQLKGAQVEIDPRFPPMDASSAVFPTVRVVGADIVLAYHLPGCEDSAVVRFQGASSWCYGGPNDEGLARSGALTHGICFYEFHAVTDQPTGATRWLATFHDGLIEVVAQNVEIIAALVPGCRPWEALDKLLGQGRNEVLDE